MNYFYGFDFLSSTNSRSFFNCPAASLLPVCDIKAIAIEKKLLDMAVYVYPYFVSGNSLTNHEIANNTIFGIENAFLSHYPPEQTIRGIDGTGCFEYCTDQVEIKTEP